MKFTPLCQESPLTCTALEPKGYQINHASSCGVTVVFPNSSKIVALVLWYIVVNNTMSNPMISIHMTRLHF